MKYFFYKGRDAAGQNVQGKVPAVSKASAAQQIQRQGILLVELQERFFSGKRNPFASWHFSAKQRAFFCRQLALMLQAGLPIVDSLDFLAQYAGSAPAWELVQGVAADVRSGSSLSQALQQSSLALPDFWLVALAAGETSGNLDEVLAHLAAEQERLCRSKERLQTVLLYPIFVLILTLGVIGFLFWVVLPVFAEFFQTLALPLPFLTQCLLQLRAGFMLYGGGAFLGLLIVLAGFRYWLRDPGHYRLFHRTLLQIPFWGTLWKYQELYRILSIWALLLNSGIPLQQALQQTAKISNNRYLQWLLDKLCQSVHQGYALTPALQRCPLLPPFLVRTLALGELTGNLPVLLKRAAAYCQLQAEMRMERFEILLEPCLLLFLGGLVGWVVFAMALPMLEAISAFA